MNLHNAPAEAVCNALLDDQLDASERWSVQRRMDHDGHLAALVQAQRRVAESMRRNMAVPELDAMLARVERMAQAAPQPCLRLVAPTTPECALPASGRTKLLLQWAAALLVCCLALWSTGEAAQVRIGNPELTRAIESNLAEAMALGVAGAAALVGGRRLSRGRRGRFVLDQMGLRLELPQGVSDAVALHAGALGTTLVYRSSTGLRAVAVVDAGSLAAGANQAPSPGELNWRQLGSMVLFGSNQPGSAPALNRFEALGR